MSPLLLPSRGNAGDFDTSSGVIATVGDANDLVDGCASLLLKPDRQLNDDVDQQIRLHEYCRADLNGACTGHEELKGIIERRNTPQTDHRDRNGSSDLVDHSHRYGLHGRP